MMETNYQIRMSVDDDLDAVGSLIELLCILGPPGQEIVSGRLFQSPGDAGRQVVAV